MITPHRSVRYLTVILPSLAIAACDPEPPIDNRPMPTLDLAQCTQTWRTLFAPAESPSWAEDLRLEGDRLFFIQHARSDAGVVSVPTTGGAATTVSQEGGLRFWIEGEQLIFVTADGLFRRPLGGGPVEQVLGGPHFDRTNLTTFPSGWALDHDSLFWAEHVPPNTAEKATIWRGLRDGGGETALGALTSNGLIDEILPIDEQLIVTANRRAAVWTVPKGSPGGTPQPLAWLTGTRTRLQGILDDGRVLFTRVEPTDEGHPNITRFVVGRSRVDGTGAETIWTTTQPLAPTGAWSDGAGGWYVSTTETATDLTGHAAIWKVDGAGKGVRLACDPKAWSTIESAVATRGALYLLVEQSGAGSPNSPPPPRSWQLASVTAFRGP